MVHAIRIHHPGGPEVLQWEEVAVGDPGPGQIKIRQTAVGLNFLDVYHRTGLYPVPTPFIPGTEGAGVIEAVGEGVTGLAPGDRVAYPSLIGAYAEARLAAADRVVKLPASVDDRTAAAMMLQGMTARYLIREIYKVGPDDTILIHAAAGGVGLIVCQWASALGASVIGTVSTEEKAALARRHGCHYPIVTKDEDFLQRVLQITNGRKLKVVYDSIGRDTFDKSLDCLRPRGLMVTFGQSSGKVPPLDLGVLAAKGSLMITRPTLNSFIATRAELETAAADLFEMVGGGKVKINVNQTFPLREAGAAHHALEARRTTGSTVLLP
ncbi:MAG TPA: quinone oxidoreductase [Stellaceae bacterium]|nr:quinone oxidoreductase [Stellaceae bacterium]